jgi:hypothetical protein
MYSYRQFIPGGKSDTSRIINYISEYNNIVGTDVKELTCYCIPDKYDKNTPGSELASARISYNARMSQIIRSSKGGKINYGNFYLGEPLNVNYLGRVEGMPNYPLNVNYLTRSERVVGGSGRPPKNIFN